MEDLLFFAREAEEMCRQMADCAIQLMCMPMSASFRKERLDRPQTAAGGAAASLLVPQLEDVIHSIPRNHFSPQNLSHSICFER